jgi:molybdopterin converting factor small subunit
VGAVVVRVRLFAMLRQRAGRDAIELELPDGARVSDALAAVDDLAGGLSLVLAVNREYAAPDQVLAADDELALIPPVSGGAHALITPEPLSIDAVAAPARGSRTRAPGRW